jgi:hypothetical protein
VAAPAFAASGPCVGALATATLGNQGSTVNSLTFQPSGLVATVSITAQRSNGSPMTLTSTTGKVDWTDYNSPPNAPEWKYITLRHIDSGSQQVQQGDKITLTITFPKFVTGATLQITDIDKTLGDWIDEVAIFPLGFTFTKVNSMGTSLVTGSGSAADPFKCSQNVELGDARGDVILNWAGQVKQIVITYTAADAQNQSDNGQHIGVGKFGYIDC